MAWFISFACNRVQPVHKGVTGIGAHGLASHAGGVRSIAISWTIRFLFSIGGLIIASLAVVKISGKINRHAGLAGHGCFV
jgi:hypothetical protein